MIHLPCIVLTATAIIISSGRVNRGGLITEVTFSVDEGAEPSRNVDADKPAMLTMLDVVVDHSVLAEDVEITEAVVVAVAAIVVAQVEEVVDSMSNAIAAVNKDITTISAHTEKRLRRQ